MSSLWTQLPISYLCTLDVLAQKIRKQCRKSFTSLPGHRDVLVLVFIIYLLLLKLFLLLEVRHEERRHGKLIYCLCYTIGSHKQIKAVPSSLQILEGSGPVS